MFESIEIKTTEKYQMCELLDELKKFVAKHHVKRGVIYIHVPHTTAALSLNKNFDPEVQRDILEKLDQLIPENDKYKNIEGTSAAHIKAAMFGNTATLIIEDGRIELGMFQSVYLCEFNGPRKRRVNLKIIEG